MIFECLRIPLRWRLWNETAFRDTVMRSFADARFPNEYGYGHKVHADT